MIQPNLFDIPGYQPSKYTEQPREHDGKFAAEQQAKFQKVKQAFENGAKLSTQDCYRSFGTTELRKHVATLRAAGMRIADAWHRSGSNRYKVYWLNKNVA